MSMSSLGAQLASLHSKSTKNPGAILATSKRKSDVVGRGVTHSAQHGHALKKSNFKPSVLYEDSKAASDVPLTTLRENAFSSVHQLVVVDTDFDQYLSLVNLQSLQSERGQLTKEENQDLNKSIRGLLNLIGSVLQESSSRSPTSIYSSCLHVLEYLLRRHDVHLRNAQDLLVAILPHHDDILFGRVVQLVDLASMPTFNFLRPYAAAGNGTPSRTILAKQAAKDAALFKIFCQSAQFLKNKQRRGASMVISFSCAVVVESLTLQARATGTLEESTVRVLMPFIQQACASQQGGDWRGFGYVVTSTLADHAELSTQVLEKLAKAVIKGGVDMDALTLVMAILPKKTTALQKVDKTIKGLDLPKSVFQGLTCVDSIEVMLGQLNQEVNVTPLVATLLDLGLQHKMFDFVITLVSGQSLESLWKENSLIASVAATIVNLVAENTVEPDDVLSLLEALRKTASSACDKGIAHSVMLHRKSNKPTKERIAKTLGVQVSSKDEEPPLLPPRVALEHADASVRKTAMQQLVEQPNNDDSLLSALLRHFVVEEETEMVLAAAVAIDKVLSSKKETQFTKETCDLVAQSLAKYSLKKGKALESALNFGGQALKWMINLKEDGIESIIVMLVSNCDQSKDQRTKGVSAAASKAICVAFSEKKNDINTARKVIATNPIVMASTAMQNSSSFQKKALFNVMSALSVEIENTKSHGSALEPSAWKAVNTFVQLLSTNAIGTDNLSVVLKCVQFAAEHAAVLDVLELVSKFAMVTSDESFDAIAVPALNTIASTLAVSPVTTFLEVALRTTLSATVVVRLVKLVTGIMKKEKIDPKERLVAMLALLGHSDHDVRKSILDMFSDVQELSKTTTAPVFKALSSDQGSIASTILMDGAATLPSLLRSVVSGKKSPLRRLLLEQCVDLATAEWLPLAQASGSMHALSVVLGAAELAGESAFPLLDRWSVAGDKILGKILSAGDSATINDALIDSVVRMLKGAIVHDSSELVGMIISSGPSKRGTRVRSYSVGRSSGVSFTDPYPTQMLDAINKCLDVRDDSSPAALEICRTLIRDVLSSKSWCNSVFKELPHGRRVAIANGLLQVLSTQVTDDAVSSILHLPLDASDISDLLQTNVSDLRALAVLMDHIRSNAGSLAQTKAVAEATSSLFGILLDISSSDKMEEDDGGITFAQHSTLHALVSLVKIEDSEFAVVKKKDLKNYTKLLVNLIGDSDGNSVRHLSSWKARKTALTLMSRLCSLHPSIVVKDMTDAMLTCIKAKQINDSDSVQTTLSSIREVLSSIVPVFHDFCAMAKLSLFGLLDSFLKEVELVTDVDSVKHLLRSMTVALASTGDEKTVVCFFSLLIARGIKAEKSVLSEVVDLVKTVGQPIQTKCVLTLCAYTNELLLFAGEETNLDGDAPFAGVSEYLFDKCSEKKPVALRYCRDLCGLLLQTLSLPSMENYVKHSNDSPLCLQLWQDLLLLQSTSAQVESSLEEGMDDEHMSKKLFEHCKDRIEESLSAIQHALPIPVFLASVTSLIEDEDNGALRTRALRFLAERASDVHSSSPEASLFLDLLPLVVGLLEDAKNDDEGMMLQQSAAMVVEQFARTLCLPSGAPPQHAVKPFLDALKQFTSRLCQLSNEKKGREVIAYQLACSLALSVSTLVRLLKARCLPVLPKLVDALLAFLAGASKPQPTGSEQNQNKLVQVSMLRAMTSVAEHLPQFLIPHLDKVLSPAVLPSFTIDEIDLVATLAEKVPSRQLLPASGRALKKCSHASEFSVLLKLTKASVEQTSRGEIGAVTGHVLQSILHSCDFDTSLMEVANQVLLSLVMKLSEAQLRPVYAKLRAWRGDDNASRKFAFWSISSVLSRELKSIFLPCLSTVVDDVLQELDVAVSVLCTARKTKKTKVGTVESLQYLPALLSCLGHCFAADAREGGSWIREDGEERYHSFREPLSTLLLSRVLSDFPFASGDVKDPYHELIVQDGGLITCLVALASAAGNDALWKPLNHAVLVACGNEDRVEIQRAGLTCLLKLMQTLGEEYMVLLPECLPVLSELLEADEGTAAIARDCVEISEDLLGESLEDSLR